MRDWGKAFYEHRYLILYSFLTVVMVSSIAIINGAKASEFYLLLSIAQISAAMTFAAFWFLLCCFFLQSFLQARREKTANASIEKLFYARFDAFMNSSLATSGVVGIIPLYFTAVSLDVGKSLITYINAYHWDPFFSDLDKAIHFGHYPYELLIPAVSSLHLARLMDASYIIWFLFMFMANAYCLFCDQNLVRRKRYLWTVVLSWTLIGIGCATFFASVGPIFYHDVYPELPDPYAGLIAHLKSVYDNGTHLSVIKMSPHLLEMANNNRVIDVNGPSAMPSMHVGISWLIFLYTFSISRKAGLFVLPYFALILTGSVYLAWHYAIDGYAGMVLVTLIWFAMGRIFRSSVDTCPI